jgi:SAM-dependent methyltransferase
MLSNPSASRNKGPILEVLKKYLSNKPGLNLLEISSGVGEHVAYFAPAFPNIAFQPSEHDKRVLSSIEAYAQACPSRNIMPAMNIDITEDYSKWAGAPRFIRPGAVDYMLNINMIHISPLACSEGLFRNAGELLKPQGLLITYGPYAENGVLTPESNVSFDQSLKSRNPEWGIKDIVQLKELATAFGIEFLEKIDMPANNKCLIWRKL